MIKLIEPNRKYLEQYQEAYILSLKEIGLGNMKEHDLIFSNTNEINLIQKAIDAKNEKKIETWICSCLSFFLNRWR